MPSAGDYIRASDTTAYYCKATQGVAQTLTTATHTAITFDNADDVDTLGIHDPSTNNSRFTIGLKLGWWQVSGVIWFAGGTTATRRGASIAVNGSRINGGSNIGWAANTTGGSAASPVVAVQATLSTDYVELQGYQDTGGNLATTAVAPFLPQFTAVYLGP